MTNNTIFCGLALLVMGLYGFFNGTPEEETGKVSPTALIPAYFGAAFLLCAVVVILRENLRKHVMHLAALIGVVGILGGFMPIYRLLVVKQKDFEFTPAVRSGLFLSAVCAIFVWLCVKSFIDARKAREAAAQGPAA